MSKSWACRNWLCPGGNLAFGLEVTNAGLEVDDAQLTFVSGLNDVRWLRGDIDSNQSDQQAGSGDFSIQVDIPATSSVHFRVSGTVPLDVGEWFFVTATIMPAPNDPQGDPNLENNTAIHEAHVAAPQSALTTTTIDPSQPWVPGEQVTYSFHVANDGTAATGVRIVDESSQFLSDVTWVRQSNTHASDVFIAKNESPRRFPWWTEATTLDGQNGFVFEGRNPLPESRGFRRTPIGESVSGGGDFNGDGISDVVIGGRGEAYVLFGSSEPGVSRLGPDTIHGHGGLLINGFRRDYRNTVVSFIADFNSDDIDDVLVAAPPDDRRVSRGEAYVVFGSREFDSLAIDVSDLDGRQGFAFANLHDDVPIQGDLSEVNSAAYAVHVAAAGDVNHDGVSDLSISLGPILDANEAQVRPAESFVVFGGPNVGTTGTVDLNQLDGETGFVMPNTGPISGGGDANGDGVDDIVVEAAAENYAVFGRPDLGANGVLELSVMDGRDIVTIAGVPSNIRFAGDVNNDGFDDLILGAPFEEEDPEGRRFPAGAAFVVFGNAELGRNGPIDITDLNGTNGFRINAQTLGDQAGQSVAAVGDLNGDGIDDFAIGARRIPAVIDRGGPSLRKVHIVFGSEALGTDGSFQLRNLTGQNGFTLHTYMSAGVMDISRIGDFNNDGINDVALDLSSMQHIPRSIDSPYYGDGETYIIFGRKPIITHGAGDVFETLDILEFQAVTYTVTGLVKSDLGPNPELMINPTAHLASDVSVTVLNVPETASPGERISYTIEVSNNGPVPNVGVLVEDRLSANLQEVTWTRDGGEIPSSRRLFDLNETEGRLIDPAQADELFANRLSYDYNGDGVMDDIQTRIDSGSLDSVIRHFDLRGFGEDTGRRIPVGDINDDGFDDLLVLASFENGAFILFGSDEFGNNRLAAKSDFSNVLNLRGTFSFNYLVPIDAFLFPRGAGVGDVNADGIDDLLVSSPITDAGRGVAYVVFGSRDLGDETNLHLNTINGGNGFELRGVNRDPVDADAILWEGDIVGSQLGGAGDWNNDGIADILIDSARGSYVVFGAKTSVFGSGPLSDQLDIPTGNLLTYTVTGTVADDAEQLKGEVAATTGSRQLDTNLNNDAVSLEIQLEMPVVGDIDGDRLISLTDFLILQENFGRKDARRNHGDLDGDEQVNFSDFLLLSVAWRRG